MRTRSMLLAAAAAVTLAAGSAQAQEAMATAGATGLAPSEIKIAEAAPTPQAAPARAEPAPLVPLDDTARQIDRWLADSPAAASEDEPGLNLNAPRDRQVHGEVGMAIGTGGYRSAYVTSIMPLGQNGTLALSVGQEKNGYPRYYRDGYGYGYGPGYAPGYGHELYPFGMR